MKAWHGLILSLAVVGGIVYAIYSEKTKDRTKIISGQVKETEASIQQEESKSSPFSFSENIPETFNYITCDRKDFNDSGAALARSRQ